MKMHFGLIVLFNFQTMLLLCRLGICSSTTAIALCSRHDIHVHIPESQSSHSPYSQPETPELSQVRCKLKYNKQTFQPKESLWRVNNLHNVGNYTGINQRTR